MKQSFPVMEKCRDPEALPDMARGIANIIRNGGHGVLTADETAQLVEKTFAFIDQSLERSRVTRSAQAKLAELVTEDVGSDDNADEEEQCRESLEGLLGVVMEASPAQFMPFLPLCINRITMWLESSVDRVLGLYLARDLVQHLGSQSEPAWPVFMLPMLHALSEPNVEAWMCAAVTIAHAARLQNFNGVAPCAFKGLAQIVGCFKPKKHEEKAKIALDGAVFALFTLIIEKPALCPSDIQAWQLVIKRLPLRDDWDKAKHIHRMFVDLVIKEEAALLGGAEKVNLGAILSILAEIYHVDNICDQATGVKIKSVFENISQDILQRLAGSFTEKQQKKVTRMRITADGHI